MAPDHDGPHPWLPLTRAQQGLWFADELAGGSAAYTTAEVVEVPAPGLDHARLAHAQARAHREHEQLRTRFAATPDGPRQQVLDLDDATLAARLEHVTVADRATADAWLVATLARPLRIAEGEVVRSALLHLADGSTWWFHAAHHVVLDGYGYLQLARRVADLYRDPTAAPPRAATVADLVAEDTARTVDAAWWDDRLAGWDGTSSPVGSPVDSPAAATPAPAPHRAEVELDPAAGDDLAAVARAFRVGIDAVVLAAAGTYLARLLEPAGPEGPEGSAGHVRLGVPLMNRTGPSGRALTATTVCTAMNVVPLAVPATGRPSDVVRAVAAELAAVRDGAHVRAEDLERRLRRRAPDARLFGPTVNVLPFASELDLGPRGTPLVGRVRNLAAGPVEDLTWGVRGAIGRGPVRVEVAAHPERYDAGATALHAHRLATWLGTFARAAVTVTANRADGEHDVTDLPLLHAAERHLVVATFNATDHPVRSTTLPAAFAAQVARTPGAPAVLRHAGDPADPGAWEAWTYADLDDAAGRVAAGLRA
ncbi:MAG TPA: condensation domain-containing protein, partial [Nocardioides sp.]